MKATAERLGRALRKPPRYTAWRLSEEARRRSHRLRLDAARRGRGPLSPGRPLPSEAAVLDATRRQATALAPWGEAAVAIGADTSSRARLVERSAQALARRAALFDATPVPVGDPPRWHEDVRTGYRWPVRYHGSLDYRNLDRPSDVKVAWELSRLRHCVALAQAAAVLGDERAYAALDADLRNWHDENPLGWSVNWTCAMEVALRAVNMICIDAILLTRGSDYPLRRSLVRSLYRHGWFLVRHLEISDVNGNHFLADAVGLVWLGRYFGDYGEAPRWLGRGLDMVQEAAGEQVLPDGLDVEGSLPYHVLVLELFLAARAAAGDDLRAIDERLGAMLDAACSVAGPGGRIPNIGDDDGGRALALSEVDSRDSRRVLALGAGMLGHQWAGDVARGGSWEDAIWLLGPAAADSARGAGRPRARHRRFGSAGIVVLGDGLDRVVIDCGPVGFYGRGGHGHLDATSFEAVLGGRLAVRDSGTASYTGDPGLREALRGARAHNVVIVDGLEYAQLQGPELLWNIRGDSPPEVVAFEDKGDAQSVELRQTLPAAHGSAALHRTLDWRGGGLAWADEVRAPAGALVEHVVQLPDGVRLDAGVLEGGGFTYTAEIPAGAELTLEAAPWSERYGSVEDGTRAVVAYRAGPSPNRVAWTVAPSR